MSIRNLALYSSTTPLADNGPWRTVGVGDADPLGPAGANVLMSTDPSYSVTIPVGTEYEAQSESFINITGLTTAQLDSGDSFLRLRLQATRMTSETEDEFRFGVHFYDNASALIYSITSEVIGTAAGLFTAVWADFSRLFAIPVNSRKFKYRIIAVKRNSVWRHARLEFANARATGLIQQFTPFADTHATILDKVARDYWGLNDTTIEVGSIQQLKNLNPGKAYFYDPSPTFTRFDWTKNWLSDIMALPTYSSSGRFAVSQIRDLSALHEIKEKHIFKPPNSLEPTKQHKARTLDYAKNYTLQNADTLAGAVDEETAAFVSLEYRSIKQIAASMAQAFGAIESRSQTNFADLTGAQAEVIRQLALLSPNKGVWVLALKDFQLKIKVCDVARVTYPRWRFTTPRAGIVLHVQEESVENTTTIYWWG